MPLMTSKVFLNLIKAEKVESVELTFVDMPEP